MDLETLTAFDYEHTDTFGGEANYCWVKRGTVMARNLNHAVRLAKAACNLTGVRCRREGCYSGIALTPIGWAQVLFVDHKEV